MDNRYCPVMRTPSHRTPNSEGLAASSKPDNSKEVSTGKSQMLSTVNVGD